MRRKTRTAAAAWWLALVMLIGCSTSSGNLYFLSVQRVGVDVAASDPSTNGAPNISIGYESIKGTVNPVKEDTGQLRGNAYSVLGITGTSTSGSKDTGLAVSEWFATGRAAEILAQNELTPVALAGTKSLSSTMIKDASDQELAKTYSAIANTQVWLSSLVSPSATQQQILAGLDGLDRLVNDLKFKEFAADGTRTDFVPPAVNGWDRVEQARAKLRNSIVRARNRSRGAGVSDAEKQQASDAAVALQTVLSDFDRRILDTNAARAAWEELVTIVKAGGE